MHIPVFLNENKVLEIPSSDLIKFKRFCELNGYQLKWKDSLHGIKIESALPQKMININLSDHGQKKEEMYMKKELTRLLNGDVLFVSNQHHEKKTADLTLVLEGRVNPYTSTPTVTILYTVDLKPHFKKHLDAFRIQNNFKRAADKNTSLLTVQLNIPKALEDSDQSFYRRLAISLASGIMDYFLDKKNSSHAFPVEVLKMFTGNHQNNQVSIAPKESSRLPKRVPGTREQLIDMYLDYTIYPSSEEEMYIIKGDIVIKNSGNTDVNNPLVCLKVDPVDTISIGGQILPPDIAETMGVHTSKGISGWKFMYEDWFERAKERGEYWISPISDFTITSGEQLKISDVQFIVKKPSQQNMARIKSFLITSEQNQKFASQNSITISF